MSVVGVIVAAMLNLQPQVTHMEQFKIRYRDGRTQPVTADTYGVYGAHSQQWRCGWVL